MSTHPPHPVTPDGRYFVIRGPAWWSDGALDFNRHLVKDSPFADWSGSLGRLPTGRA